MSAFTLVELLVSMTILIVILVLGLNVLGQTSGVWQRSLQQVQAFQSARLGFDLLTRDLGQATLNTYLEYMDGSTSPGPPAGPYFASEPGYNNLPLRYARKSDLHFVCAYPGTTMKTGGASSDASTRVPGTAGTGTGVFFQAPLGYTAPSWTSTSGAPAKDIYNGLDTLLNPVGYYVEFGADSLPVHVAVTPKNQRCRYRLKQLLIPSDRNTIFGLAQSTTYAYDPADPARWFTGTRLTRPNDTGSTATTTSNVHAVADNIVALVVRVQDPSANALVASAQPYLGTTTPFFYDSHANERDLNQPATANQIPPVIQVTMVAIDEVSATRLDAGTVEPGTIRAVLDAQVKGRAKFTELKNYDDDLAALESGLRNLRINYRVFATAVPIRESKWSK